MLKSIAVDVVDTMLAMAPWILFFLVVIPTTTTIVAAVVCTLAVSRSIRNSEQVFFGTLENGKSIRIGLTAVSALGVFCVIARAAGLI